MYNKGSKLLIIDYYISQICTQQYPSLSLVNFDKKLVKITF